MSTLAILIGSYSYAILFLGILGFLYKPILLVSFLFFTVSILIMYAPWAYQLVLETRNFKKDKMAIFIILLLIAMAVVNGIGALGPELAFDALWYHLTIPKLYLKEHSVFFIPGNLLYYSAMPKLTEMLYIPALALGSETIAKLIHFFFGILSCAVLFKVSRLFFSRRLAFLCALLFYSNLVVAWQSTTAYIDLSRTFWEIMALWFFINWYKDRTKKRLIMCAVMTGFAVASKLIAVSSILIFTILIVYSSFISKKSLLKNLKQSTTNILVYWYFSFLIPLPWFLFAFFNTGNPFYPLFTKYYDVQFSAALFKPVNILKDFWLLFARSSDPLSPIYLLTFPLLFIVFKKLDQRLKLILTYCVLSYLAWYLTPRTGGGRFFMPYLPAYSIIAVGVLRVLKKASAKILYRTMVFIIVFVSLITIGYRGFASITYLPVIFGVESKQAFLTKNLNFGFGDFYDIDDYFKRNIKSTDKVLLYGFHNLYYVDFPFTHESWVKKGDVFTHVAVQNVDVPTRFKDWDIRYKNPKTGVSVLKKGEKPWTY